MSFAKPTEPLTLRRALLSEAASVASLVWRVREDNRGTIPASVHPLGDMQRWMRDVVFKKYDVWVASNGNHGDPVAALVLGQPDWIEHLYVDSDYTSRGLGSRLLEVARRELSGSRIQLWTFQSNVGAGRFYERHGFVAVQWTDGDNEESAPDVRYEWVRPRRNGP